MLGSNTLARAIVASPKVKKERRATVFSAGWLGQTVASLCWIASVFAYGVETGGDLLQLFAGVSWLLANVAELATHRVG